MTDYIRDSIYEELLSNKKEEAKTAAEEEWKNAAKIETHIDKMVEYD